MSALPDRPRSLAPGLRVLMPDRLAVWPTERGFGLDVTWNGADGIKAAESVRNALTQGHIPCRLVQGMARDWTVRVGPASAAEVRSVIDLFLPVA